MLNIFLTALILLPTETSVVADSELQGWRVAGQMYLDETFTGSETTKRVAATCQNCKWLVTNYCKRDNPFQQINSCDLPVLGCETDLGNGVKHRIWRQVTVDEDWQDVGVVCITPKGPVTPSVVSEVIREEAVVFLPPLNPTSRPKSQALVKLPVYFSTNQPTRFGPKIVNVAGFEVLLTAYPTWVWSFQDQQVITKNQQISHTWNKSGRYLVSVNAMWDADWQILGSSKRPAPNLEQRSNFYLQLRPAWGQLTR